MQGGYKQKETVHATHTHTHAHIHAGRGEIEREFAWPQNMHFTHKLMNNTHTQHTTHEQQGLHRNRSSQMRGGKERMGEN